MRESLMYGSVRGARGNSRPYRDPFALCLTAAELVGPRAETKGNVGQQSTRRTQSRISVSQVLALH